MKTTRMLLPLICSLFCLLFFLPTAYAQTEKGTLLLGGNASMSFNSQMSNKSFGVSIYPQVGFFVANKFALGANVSLGYSSYDVNSFRSGSIGIGPFVRYYLGAGKAIPFLEARGGWNHYQSKYKEPNGTTRKDRQNSGYGGLGLGLAYFLTPTIGLESLLSYDLYRQNSYTNRALNLRIGFQIYFSRNKE
ncbi:outer membrane beta-barrel protein [Rhodocytophaga rosea]|uniref:Outer membrane beta-barrel protein n=1 Tax=Rhodocytophaga rosea TaxID=2704465 RepID=A0A6C0GGD4_9BACT|nr:outer membrane beta-barrel protein [Rhodocytophaga rosea]QHT66843.1 outer membrane beta-barrel protein [Rhodocytophaga rosea]